MLNNLYLDITGNNITDIYLTGVIVALLTVAIIITVRFDKRQNKHTEKNDAETELYQSIVIAVTILIIFTYYAEYVRTNYGNCTKHLTMVREGSYITLKNVEECK